MAYVAHNILYDENHTDDFIMGYTVLLDMVHVLKAMQLAIAYLDLSVYEIVTMYFILNI